ncbi:MAG: hypothetical protein JRI46_10405 [Deltaproteobacteria bacterium]|nr:hypothetical protein [Deltaproteobacteria bacterium]
MRKVTLGLVVSILALVMAATASADLNQFAGRWKNTDPDTRGVTTLNIRVRGTNVTVQAWGKCHPKDCDWGRVKAYAYAPSVSSNLADTAQALSAAFRTGFSQNLMIIHPVGRNRLRAEVLTRFTDRSGRTNYRAVYTFARVRTVTRLSAPRQISPANGAVFTHFPRTTTLRWSAVPGAASYTVEIDCYNCCQANKWCTDVGRTWKVVTNLTTTSYTFDFVGAQPGRWRVWAVGAGGQKGPKTGWWEFRYTR